MDRSDMMDKGMDGMDSMNGMDGLDRTTDSSLGLDTSSLVVPYPLGSNDSETVISGVAFNLSTLEHWNYALYSNDTISNISKCYLTFEPYQPAYIFPNGSWTNATTCYTAINGIGPRAGIGLGFVVALSVCLIMSTVNLTRLGRQFLPTQKRFLPVGRRWQWYWSIAACSSGMVSLVTNIDVDRYYVTEIPIVLNVFFWYLMQLAAIASVWEAARHWASWMERQAVDPDATVLRQDDIRARVEFYLPLIFYLCWWLNLFMTIPRAWTPLEHQRYPGQAELEAEPMATDSRFKAGGFLLLVAWINICFSLGHSIYHYDIKSPNPAMRTQNVHKTMPLRFGILLPVTLGLVVYQIVCSFDFDASPSKLGDNMVAMYVGGYTPTLLIVIVHNIFGFLSDNEDKALIAQRRERDLAWDREQRRAPKPRWWDLVKFGNLAGMTTEQRLARHTQDVRPTRQPYDVEIPPSIGGQIPQQQQAADTAHQPDMTADEPPPPYTTASPDTAAGMVIPVGNVSRVRPQTGRPGGNSIINGPPRQIRSMLDV